MSVPADVQNSDGSSSWWPDGLIQSQKRELESQGSEIIRLRAENLRLEAELEGVRRELAIEKAEKEKALRENARLKRALSTLLASPEQ